jgi:bifunctional enzyme CysN/CysC
MTVADTDVGDVGSYLEADDRKTLLRFITCGSVDDGKSTLIGRLLYESKLIYDDQLAALEADSRRVGTQGGALDFALLVDGLAAEREQGITIDVAYRFFTTERRKFIVADTPGHEQYTRNMVTGASTADAAVILVDARKGVLTQTRRHTFIMSLLGIRHIALAVNKLDLVGYSQQVFDRIVAEYRQFAAGLGLTGIQAIPLSALLGENVLVRGENTPWYDGPSLAQYLETVEVGAGAAGGPFRLAVQTVIRPDLDFRGYAGIVAGGTVRPGDEVHVLPSGASAKVARIVTWPARSLSAAVT